MFIPTGYAQANYFFEGPIADQEVQITHGIDVASVLEDWEAMADALMSSWVANWESALSNNYALDRVELRVNVGGPFPLVAASTQAAQTGLDTGDPPTPNCAVLIQKRTGLGGRSQRGRFYFPPIVNVTQLGSDGLIGSVPLAARQTIANDWLTEVNGLTGVTDMVLLHTNPALDPTPITSLVVDSRIATQRRRLRD